MHYGVAPYNGVVFPLDVADGQPVDNDTVGFKGKPDEGPCHGQRGGAKDVSAVNLSDGCRSKRNRERPLADLARDAGSGGGAEELGICRPLNRHVLGQNHRRGHDRTGQRPAPDFVDSGNPGKAAVPEAALVAQGVRAVQRKMPARRSYRGR